MNKEINLIEIMQPIGTFYVGKMYSDDLVNCFYVRSRDEKDGIQRLASSRRVDEIESYCKDPDATFPTPIILSVDSSKCTLKENSNTNIKTVVYENNKEIFEGDIVLVLDSPYTVFYDNEKGSYRLKPHDDRWNVDYMSNFSHGGNFEVVGNIYENKEYL